MDNTTTATLAKLLGVFFYYPPNNNVTTSLTEALLHLDLLTKWGDAKLIGEQCQILTNEIDNPELNYQFSVLFEGQGVMEAPPWGSVYLDKEHLLMGESQEYYRQFLQQHGIQLNTGLNEPEDQFGLMLMAYALLLEKNKINEANKLMSEHLMTWAFDYLERLIHNSVSQFYQALATITKVYLNLLYAK